MGVGDFYLAFLFILFLFMKLNPNTLGLSAGLVSAVGMLLLSILNGLGYYQQAAVQMMGWHMFYTPTVLGTFSGMIEAAVITYLFVSATAWMYNYLLGTHTA